MRSYLLISHINIHNANAMSSPYTIGFPALTAWLGAVHALQRNIQQRGMSEIFLPKLAVSCHKFNLQAYRGKGDYVNSIIGTANPLKKKNNQYERPPFIEEARCHVEVSLIIEVSGVDGDNAADLKATVHDLLYKMKMAGGDIISFKSIDLLFVDGEDEMQVKNLRRKLMPGYVLIERRDLMTASMAVGKDALSALLDHIKVTYRSSDDDNEKVIWSVPHKKERGWIVPIAVGFQGISEICKAKNQRDENTAHRFAESVITLGEFKMPYRFQNIEDMMWSYSVDLEQDLYVCKNQQ